MSQHKQIPTLTASDLARFWQFVDKRGPLECWPWKGGLTDKGYGYFYMSHDGMTRQFRAHRVSFFIHTGQQLAEDGLHRCDNRACVNPACVFPGNNADNVADCVRKGRVLRGEQRAQAKLDVARVQAIRRDNSSHTEVAMKYSVSESTISRIRSRQLWSHV